MCIHLSWHHPFCNMSFQRMEGTLSFHRPRGEHCFQPNSPDCPSLTGKGKRHFNSVEHKSPARIAEQQECRIQGSSTVYPHSFTGEQPTNSNANDKSADLQAMTCRAPMQVFLYRSRPKQIMLSRRPIRQAKRQEGKF